MNLEPKRIRLTPLAALEKAKNWCAYQERCTQEVRDKLYEWGLNSEEVENAICVLIEEKFLSELRYAQSFARGKFRIKRWGRIKIRSHLKFKRISEPCIKEAMKEIDPEQYYEALIHVAQVYLDKCKESNPLKRKHKAMQYLQSRGFEGDLVMDVLKGEGGER